MVADDSNDDRTQSFVALTADTTVLHYKIVEKIGAGGMGDVYLAEDTELDRKVALKFLPPHLCQDEDCRKRFRREAQAAARLDHPNIAGIYEVGDYNGRPFYSMQVIQGQSLREVIAGKDLPIERILEIAIQVCGGLQAAHDKGITHRDIKPSNILIDSHSRVRIVDFGLAAISGSEQLTKTGSTLGTIGYMSPEQVQGKEVDHRSDLFSFGVVLYELITKRNPFKRDSEAATLKAISDDTPHPVARYRADVLDGLQAIIDKSLEKDVKTRYQHADGMLADLMRIKRSLESGLLLVSGRSSLRWWVAVILIGIATAIALTLTKPWVSDTTSDKPEKIMLAVLPFENLGDPEDEYFADGITDEITSRLAAVHSLGVIARTSVIQYKHTTKDIPQIALELGVGYVLEGTIRWDRTGDTDLVRITPQLIKASNNTHIWADNFERALTSIFSVQAEIGTQIVQALDLTLAQPERRALANVPSVSPEAHDYYLRSKAYFDMGRGSRSDFSSAKVLLLKAIEIAPDFALAHAELGAVYTEIYWHTRYDEQLAPAEKHVNRALEIDPQLPEAHQAMGLYYYHGHREYELALKEFEFVLRKQPSNAAVLANKAWVLRRKGDFDGSVVCQTSAIKLDPRVSKYRSDLAETLIRMRRYEHAIAQCDSAIDLSPDLVDAYVKKAVAMFMSTGVTEYSRQVVEQAVPIVGPNANLATVLIDLDLVDRNYATALIRVDTLVEIDQPDVRIGSADHQCIYGQVNWEMGRLAVAREYFDSARVTYEGLASDYPDSPIPQYSLGIIYAYLGRKGDAINAGRRALELRPVSSDAMEGTMYELSLAWVYIIVGEYELAIDELEYMMSIPSMVSLAELTTDPSYDPLREHPRFQALIEKYEK